MSFIKDFFRFEKSAFTLAEVLITLAIIGIVAAITIPVLSNNADTKANAVALKKNYAVLANAAKMVYNDYGGNIKGQLVNQTLAMNAFLPYLQYSDTCSAGQILGKCLNATRYYPKGGSAIPNSTPIGSQDTGIILNNGATYVFDADITHYAACDVDGIQGQCALITIDVNGLKLPNRYGYDIFHFIMTASNGLKVYDPAGGYTCIYPDNAGWNNANNLGYNCASQILMNN